MTRYQSVDSGKTRMAALLHNFLRTARYRLQLWHSERLFHAWRDEWRGRRGY
jgi:hypothetical protein